MVFTWRTCSVYCGRLFFKTCWWISESIFKVFKVYYCCISRRQQHASSERGPSTNRSTLDPNNVLHRPESLLTFSSRSKVSLNAVWEPNRNISHSPHIWLKDQKWKTNTKTYAPVFFPQETWLQIVFNTATLSNWEVFSFSVSTDRCCFWYGGGYQSFNYPNLYKRLGFQRTLLLPFE